MNVIAISIRPGNKFSDEHASDKFMKWYAFKFSEIIISIYMYIYNHSPLRTLADSCVVENKKNVCEQLRRSLYESSAENVASLNGLKSM